MRTLVPSIIVLGSGGSYCHWNLQVFILYTGCGAETRQSHFGSITGMVSYSGAPISGPPLYDTHMYSPLHKIVWRLFIRDKNLFETLEVSHSMSNLIPLSAKQKGGLLIIDIPFILRIMELRNYGLMANWLWESFPIKPISHIKNGIGLLLLALGLIIISKII